MVRVKNYSIFDISGQATKFVKVGKLMNFSDF